MKIIGIFILVLELIALALQIKTECKQNNINIKSLNKYMRKYKNDFTHYFKNSKR